MASTGWAEGPAAAGQTPMGGMGIVGMLPWILIFVIFYFLLIRPQQKQAKEHKEMLNALKRGDRVLTQGGIYATIINVKGEALEVKINDDVKVLIAKGAVSQLVTKDPTQETAAVTPQEAGK